MLTLCTNVTYASSVNLTYTGTYEGTAEYDSSTGTYSVTKMLALWSRLEFAYNGELLVTGDGGNCTFTGLFTESGADWSSKLYTTNNSTLICSSSTSYTYKFVFNPVDMTLNISTVDTSKVTDHFVMTDTGANSLDLLSKGQMYIATQTGFNELHETVITNTDENLASEDVGYYRFKVATHTDSTDALYLDYYVTDKTYNLSFMSSSLFVPKTFEPAVESHTYEKINVSKSVKLYIENTDVATAFWNTVYFNINTSEFSMYEVGKNDGYDEGFVAGGESVDITTDNQGAIDIYIEENNYHTDEEYQALGNNRYTTGYEDGVIVGKESVDITTDNQEAIDTYIEENNYHTNEEFQEHGNSQYLAGYDEGVVDGMESVDITTDNQAVIDQYIAEHKYHTDEEFVKFGNTRFQDGYLSALASSGEENVEEEPEYNLLAIVGVSIGVGVVATLLVYGVVCAVNKPQSTQYAKGRKRY